MFKALVLDADGDGPRPRVRELAESDLPAGDVTVAVEYSSLNYKDALVLANRGGLVQRFPHVPGVDLAGTVEASDHPAFGPGDRVLVTGHGLGEAHWGGYAGKARVPGEWVLPVPPGMTTRDVMAAGTAGLAAALGLLALEDHGLGPNAALLVTGASGGVGSLAVALAASAGHHVTAVTGRPENDLYLRGLGASMVLSREELTHGEAKPLEHQAWSGCIDAAGGPMLGRVLAQLRYGGTVAAVGLAAGSDVPISLIPFLLRAVHLIGIDTVAAPEERRQRAWERLDRDLPRERLGSLIREAALEDLPDLGGEILAGRIRGRVVVDLGA